MDKIIIEFEPGSLLASELTTKTGPAANSWTNIIREFNALGVKRVNDCKYVQASGKTFALATEVPAHAGT